MARLRDTSSHPTRQHQQQAKLPLHRSTISCNDSALPRSDLHLFRRAFVSFYASMGFHGISDSDADRKQFERWMADPNKKLACNGALLNSDVTSQIESSIRIDSMHHALALKRQHITASAGEASLTGHTSTCFIFQQSQLWDAYAEAVDAKKLQLPANDPLSQVIYIAQQDLKVPNFKCGCGGQVNQYKMHVQDCAGQSVAWVKIGEPSVAAPKRGGIIGMPPRKK